jgi:rhodanese-related sulfurtransferase
MMTSGLLLVMVTSITIDAFRALFKSDAEFAVIDPRTQSDCAKGHLLAASSMPLVRLRELIRPAVPQLHTFCVLYDAGGGEARQAAALLESLGYSNVAILEGGIDAWVASGGVVFSGVSVPGKAFGEFIEQVCSTPSMTAAELSQRLKREAPLLLIDSRTSEEHQSYCIPGAVLCAGAELVYRVLPLVDTETEIVVHCGGRTRGIIGAQTLIDAGCKNVYALENGTMAWQFEGLELETGNQESLPEPALDSLAALPANIELMVTQWHIERVDSIPQQNQHSRYLIDVRSAEEFEAGHIEGSTNVPGGHLLQNVDRYLVVRNAVVTLIDSDGVRAVTTAIWLQRMGWRQVTVVTINRDDANLETDPGVVTSPLEDRDLDPNDYADPEALMRENRAYLAWEVALLEQLPGDPAAPYIDENYQV